MANVATKLIEVTPEMIEAGLRASWGYDPAPDFVRNQVVKIYRAMELERRRAHPGIIVSGFNDLDPNEPASEIAAKLTALVDAIKEENPTADVFVGGLISTKNPPVSREG